MPLTLESGVVYNTPVFVLRSSDAAFKQVFGATYHGPTASWRFPAFVPVRKLVLADLRKVTRNLQIPPELEVEPSAEVPSDFSYITQPYQHQKDGLAHAYAYLRAGLFYAPGLGKCKIITDLLRLTGDNALILCPRVMLHAWVAELETHGQVTDCMVIDGTKEKKIEKIAAAIAKAPRVVITTYSTAALYHQSILRINYAMIVADESHQMKSPFSNRTKAAQALATRAYRRILLSGTPSLGSPFDLYAQLRFLGTYFCAEDWWSFRKKFGVYPAWEVNEKVPKMLLGFQNLELMNERANLVCLRKTKEECLDLPEQQIINKSFPLMHSQVKEYNNLITDRADAAGYGIRKDLLAGSISHVSGTALQPHVITDETITLLGKLDQLASGFLYKTTQNPRLCDGCAHVGSCTVANISPYTPRCAIVQHSLPSTVVFSKENARLEILSNLLEELLEEPSNKVIIWGNYRVELDSIEEATKKLGAEYVRVEGGVAALDLQARVAKFNKDAACRVYIGQVSTGIGITLNAANYMIYYNLPWSLEHYLQSLDRNYRIGQGRKVTVYRLLAKYTLDESKAAALDQKMDFSAFVTARGICATCPEFAKRCAEHKIKLYDDLCIHDRVKMRETAQVKLIP
jgi:SNF2 family DNA or RNA helicase